MLEKNKQIEGVEKRLKDQKKSYLDRMISAAE
jgi:hypothetical protein